jgi:DNA-binding NtrC family response regulator
MSAVEIADRRPIPLLLAMQDEALTGRFTCGRLGDDILVAGRARSVAHALRMAIHRRPELVLAEWRLRDGTGAELSRRLHAIQPRVLVIVLAPALSHRAFMETASSGAWTILDSRVPVARMRSVLRAAIDEQARAARPCPPPSGGAG